MITNARIKQLLELNLRDERMTASALFIHTLIERKVHGGGIERYRIKNKTTGQWVTSVEQFIAEIDETQIKLAYPFEGEKLQGDRVTGFLVDLSNFEVQWHYEAKSDRPFLTFFDVGTQRYFQFYLIYMNDGDEIIPLKISYTKLVGD